MTEKQHAIIFQDLGNRLKVKLLEVTLNRQIKPLYFVHKQKQYPSYWHSGTRFHNLYDGHTEKQLPIITNKDTSDFEAIKSIGDSIIKSKICERFWISVYRLESELGKYDLLIFGGIWVLTIAIIEFFLSGGFQ